MAFNIMNAEIITIGDELLIGQVINTNQAYIAERLNTAGIFAERMITIGDEEEKILKAFAEAWERYDVVAVTGGLGPTHDDITRACVCKFFDTGLVSDPQALENVRQIFARRGLEPKEINEEQALVPRGCTVIQNALGTAPGYFFERSGKYFFSMPGVPYEMKGMMDTFIVPFFEKKETGLVIRHRNLKTTGIAESFLAEEIGDVGSLFAPGSGISLAFLPNSMGVRLRITVKASDIPEAENLISGVEKKIRAKAEQYIYGTGEEELEEIAGNILAERNLTLSTAESCTGGLIADRITNVPGSSRYFERGMITYSNASKMNELGVPSSFFEQYGAVSREIAEAMASGIRMKSNTDIGLSTTGIAGPDGGSADKPVGTVWIGFSDRERTFARKFIFNGQRRIVKERAAQAALELLRRNVLHID
jgi:nicotinamide-nucleotide amidase